MTITRPASDVRARAALLARLYAEQAADAGTADECGYLLNHGRPAAIVHHVNVFEWYAKHIDKRSTVLDWGCNHGPDSCLLRHRFGDELDLHACDFVSEDTFGAFRATARARYARITDPFKLPYPDGSFDAVIGSGTLEHTAMDGEALKELYRVLRPNGLLVVTFLPHAYSWGEWRLRATGRPHHRRLYTRRGFDRLLVTHGFVSERIEFQGFIPNHFPRKHSLLGQMLRTALTPALPVLRPLRCPLFAHSVLCGLARKVQVM